MPVIALSASAGEGAELICDDGIDALLTSVNAPMSLEEAMNKAAPLYYDAAVSLFRTLRAGMRLHGQNRT
ncbi:MAG: glycerate kinase [Lachnospiraceae bacterium]|nr:glycerate kinase [Lachnospiraceae bacterium]